MDKLELVKRYIEDTVTSWEPNDPYTKGCVDTGKDILNVIDNISRGDYSNIDTDNLEDTIDW